MTEHSTEAKKNTNVPVTQKHPDEYQQDLNPDSFAGQNDHRVGPHPEKDAPTAAEMKELYDRLPDLRHDELEQIPILPPGSRLEQGATYIDLRSDKPEEFTATGGMEAGSDNWYVPKSEVDYQLWNRLIGVQNPERLGRASET
ncbi:MAG: hypothetical protein M3347_13195 [Armatimonadota bacterium]|nr:hypothetical protein [Armatimonadota bacterium]